MNFRHYKENLEKMVECVRRREVEVDVKKVVDLFTQYHAKQSEISQLRSEKNENARLLQNLSQFTEAEKGALIERGKDLREKIKAAEEEISWTENEMYGEGDKIPNDIHPAVPDTEPALLQLVGTPPNFDFTPKDHLEIGAELDLFDFETAGDVVGGKFYYSKNEVALLELALVNWATHYMTQKGFTPLLTPDLVHTRFAEACGFRPRSPSGQMYRIMDHDACLIGTSEIPLAALYNGKLFRPGASAKENFPIKLVAFSHCFRVEAGHRGRLSRGMYRVHQFSKVEMFLISRPEESDELHQYLLNLQIEILKELGLHFRVLDMPANDLGASAYRKFDIEAWFPSHNDYGEVTSCSNCTDYQARRLNMRTKTKVTDKDGKVGEVSQYVHTLNGTALAVPRIIMAILENFQTKEGLIKIPKPLVPFMNGMEWIGKMKRD
uniref:serine--tRNA ligase n=1 Tax=Arcella intermedia TaxID=1963864 RepID=A0A6B2L4C1_9EUKA